MVLTTPHNANKGCVFISFTSFLISFTPFVFLCIPREVASDANRPSCGVEFRIWGLSDIATKLGKPYIYI